MKAKHKIISTLLAVLLVVTSLPISYITNVSAASTVNVKVKGQVLYSYEYRVLTLINKERAKRGLTKFKMSQGLLSVANKRAAEISLLYAHNRPNGERNAFGMYKWNHYVGENIALNQQSPEDVVKCWMASSSHRKNILNKKFRSMGVGCFKVNGNIYWTQFFVDNKASRTVSQRTNATQIFTIPITNNNIKLYQKGKHIWIDEFYNTTVTLYQYNKTINNYDFVTNYHYSCLNFKSSNSKVAKIDSSGKITPYQNGTTTVTASLKKSSSQKISWTVVVDVEE